MPNLSIIIPAYNEEKRIGKTLESYTNYLNNKKINYEILVVINNTSDKTEKVVKFYKKKNKKIRYLNFKRGGKGFAVFEGFKNSLARKNDLIGFVDADLATPPEAFYALIRQIGNNDGIIASRWSKKSLIKTKQTFLRKITSKGFNFLVRSILFLNFTDTQCGAKLFKKRAVELIIKDPYLTEWAFDIALLYNLKKQGFCVREIPTIWEDKSGSKLDLKFVPIQMFSSIMRIRLLNSPFKFIVRFYDKLPNKVKFHKK